MHNLTIADTSLDTESQNVHGFYMFKKVVQSLSWSKITLTVEDRSTKQSKDLVSSVSGYIKAGKCMATFLMDDSMVDIIPRRDSSSYGPLR